MGMTEFWGTEVKPGQTVSCGFGNGSVIRISQVALGETKQKKEDVVVSVKVVDSKFVIGTLRAKSYPHMMCDLIFDKEFKLSHSSDTASVFFCGYKAFESDAAEDEDKGKSNGDVPAKHGCKKDGDRDDEFHSSDDMDTYEDSISSTDNLIVPTYSDEEIPGDILLKNVSSSQTYEHEGTSKKKASEIGLKLASAKENVELSCEKSGGKKGSHVATPYQSQQSSEKAMSSSQTYEHEGTSKKIGKKAAEIGLKLASVNENVVPSCQKSVHSLQVERREVMWQHLTNHNCPARRGLQIPSRGISSANPLATMSANHAEGHLSVTWRSRLTGMQSIPQLSDLLVRYLVTS